MAPQIKVPMDFGLHLRESPTHNTLKLNTSNGETVYASSVIMSFNSPVIDHMTTTLHMTSVDMLEFSKTAVEVFVDAAYSGTADGINREVFRDVNKIALVFETKWLAKKCATFFSQLVDSITEPSYQELVFLFEEAGFVFKNLKFVDYLILINKKLKDMKFKQQFIEKYLEDLSDLTTERLDMVIALAGNEFKCVVPTVIKQLSEMPQVQGACFPGSFRYLLENSTSSLKSCKQDDKDLFDQLFAVLGSLSDEHIKWTFDLYKKCNERNLAVSSSQLTTYTSAIGITMTDQEIPHLYNNLDLTLSLEELLDWLSVSETVTNLFMAVEAVATWRQYHIRTISTLTPSVLSKLYARLKKLAGERGWSLLPPHFRSYDFWFGYRNPLYRDPYYENERSFDLSPLTSSSEGKLNQCFIKCIMIKRMNEFNPFSELDRENKLVFHFKHPTVTTCNLLSNCGFILKTVRSENSADSWLLDLKLCTKEEDYRHEMVHFHDEVRADKIHLCLKVTPEHSDRSNLVPLSWLGCISSKQGKQWSENYDLRGVREFIVLYDTTM